MQENETNLGEQLAREQESYLAARSALARSRRPVELTPMQRIKMGMSVALGAKLGTTMYSGTVDEVTVAVRRKKNKVARRSRKINRRRAK